MKMQDEKAAALYKKFCGDIAKGNRIQRDLQRHNWLLLKLSKKLNNSDRSLADAAKMKPSSPLHKSKTAPKLRPTLPVCLPLSVHHRFLNTIECQKNNLMTRHTEKKSLKSLVKKKSVLDISNVVPQEDKNFYYLDKTEENVPNVNNAEVIRENKSTDTLDLSDNASTQPLHVIQINVDYDKIKTPVPVNEVSVQVPERVSHGRKDMSNNKLDITTIPLPPEPKYTQTDKITIIDGDDEELLRTVKRFNFTLEDLERLNQMTINNNNNQIECENRNIINELDDEIKDSEHIVPEINSNQIVENTSNSNEQTIQNNPSPNINGHIIHSHYQSSSITTGVFERLKLCSDLNKIILRTFYEGILIGKEKNPDNIGIENHLTHLSQNLVDQICDMVTNYNEAHGRQERRVVEIIELDDCDDDIGLGKRPSQTDDLGSTGQINGTKKIRTDSQQHQEYGVQNSQVSPNLVTQNQETTIDESQYDTTTTHTTPILEAQNLVIPYQENSMTVNQITQNPGYCIQETQNQSTQYRETESQESPYHVVSQIQINPNQVNPKNPEYCIQDTQNQPTRYRERESQESPYHELSQIQMNPNQVNPKNPEYCVQDTQNQPTRYRETENQESPYHVVSQIQMNPNQVNPKNPGYCIQETQNQPTQYREIESPESPYHVVSQMQINSNQVTPKNPGYCIQETQNQPTQYRETESQESPYHVVSQIQMKSNQVTPKNPGYCIQETQNQPTQYRETESQESPYRVVSQSQINTNHITPNPALPARPQILQNQLVPTQTLRNVLAPINEVRHIQNQMQNISPMNQEIATYTGAIPQRSTVLREFRMNSMPELPVDRSNKNDSRLSNYYYSYNDQPTENTLYPPNTQHIRKQQIRRKKHFQDKSYLRWFPNSRYNAFNPNIQTPINTDYETGNRTFQNVIQQNPQYSYNSPRNYQNIYPYNYRNSYGGNYRRR